MTFGASQPGVQAVVMTALCMLFGNMHAIVAPMREPAAQTLQSVLLLCLGIVALCANPFASALEGAAASSGPTEDSPSGVLATRCAFGTHYCPLTLSCRSPFDTSVLGAMMNISTWLCD